MTAKDAIRQAMKISEFTFHSFIDDLNDAELLIRPVPKANHAAWQIGHLINSENYFLKEFGGTPIDLPEGFAEKHSPEASHVDPPKGFLTKAEYMGLFKQVRAATNAAIDKIPDAELDRPLTGNMARLCPTAGALMVLNAEHMTMHSGQITVLRRLLGKPIKF